MGHSDLEVIEVNMHKFLGIHWNLLKLFISIWIVTGVCMCCKLNLEAREIQLANFQVKIQQDEHVQTIEWYIEETEAGKEYFLFLPYYAKQKELKVFFTDVEEIVLNDLKLENEARTDCVKEGINTISCGGKELALHVVYGSNIPVLHIQTDSGSIETVLNDKNHREPGRFVALVDEEVKYSAKLEYLKGRGNSTWTLEKKPFNIKFVEKINLFGMGAARKWCLLANALDGTKLKNKLVSDYGHEVGLQYSSKSVIVDLYIDNQYMGNYTLMEPVEVGEQRVDITDLEKLNEKANPDINIEEATWNGNRGPDSYSIAGGYKWVDLPNVPEIITGGYLLEYELAAKYDSEVSGFVSEYGQPVIIKSPEYASREQVEYIRNYYQEFENALLSGDGYNEAGKHFSDYIDIESFAKMYILQEYIKNLDAGLTSCYFYKDVGGKIVASPGWDFDSAFGRRFTRNEVKMHDPEGLWVTGGKLLEELSDKETIFTLLCRHNVFREEAQRQWITCFEPQVESLLMNLETLWEENSESVVADRFRWKREGNSYETVVENVEQLKNDMKEFILQRTDFMSKLFSEESCVLGYHANGGNGSMYDLNFYEKGSVVRLQDNIIEHDNREFLGWNTRISGWGDFYEDGDSIIIEENTTLYAQWSNPGVIERIQRMILGILGK